MRCGYKTAVIIQIFKQRNSNSKAAKQFTYFHSWITELHLLVLSNVFHYRVLFAFADDFARFQSFCSYCLRYLWEGENRLGAGV